MYLIDTQFKIIKYEILFGILNLGVEFTILDYTAFRTLYFNS